MLGQSALTQASSSASNHRLFLYEVEGLRQTDQSDQSDHAIRASGTVLISVPYNRMNEEMRRITRLGGKIVGIQATSAGQELPANAEEASAGD
ncbi:MAG: phycobilisome linker polypeptide [Synechococcales cyanobacterium CRU_2_2]|nr:phycobilisome linker polypeptide [Synechococcales cyanobacterium CRU_2_2]